MTWSVDHIVQRLQAGADPGTVLFSLLPDQHRNALRRCAALRSFDRALYDDLLRPANGPDLDTLLTADQLEPLPAAPHRYRVTASLRTPAFHDWWIVEHRIPLEPPVPSPLSELARATAERCRAVGRVVDAVDQLLLADPEAAGSLFRKLYDEADEAHDLPACEALLEVLEAPTRLTLLEQELLDLYHERRSYLAARTLWHADYHQSERYLRRPRLERSLEETLDGRRGRIAQLLGRGGMGKTMQLRWFISRRCVPEPARIPCARIDFDSVMLTVAIRDPWLLLLVMAAQLDGQFSGAPFQDLLASYGDYRVLLRRSGYAPGSVEKPVRADDLDSEDVVTRFTQTLVETAGSRQVILVFDTVEELLRPGREPTALISLLRRVHDDVPQIRLVFAGREDLFKSLDKASEPLLRQSIEVDKFDADEQARYLREIRQVSDDELVDAIVRQSGGIPFTVAVFADLVREDRSLTAADVERLRDPSLRYVIDRVVKRIDDARVRWLLRFGVIPRTLTYGFVAEVLKPFLARALIDTARQQSGNPAEQETWRPSGTTPPETETDLRDLWESLLAYAGSYSWVWVEGDANDRIRFHPDIVGPLRTLLRETDPDFRPLNRAAADYYEGLARQHPAEWPSLIREAVFHHFHADPAAGIESWRAALARARDLGRPDWARDVAEELRDGQWLEGKDGAALSRQAMAIAYIELARTASDLARVQVGERGRGLWSDAEENLRAADALASAGADVELPEPTTTILRAHIALNQGRPDDAIALLQHHAGSPPPPAEIAELQHSLGNALEALGRPEAARHYRTAFETWDRAGDEVGARCALLSLASERVENGRADVALRWLRRGERWLNDETGAVAQARALGRAGVPLQAATGLYSRGGASADAAALRAQLLADANRPEQALAAATEALQVLARSPDAAADTARILAVRGLAHAALFDFGPAIDDLLAAGDRARKRRELDDVAEYAAQRSLIRLFDMGDVRTAAQAADEALRAQGEPGREGWTLARVAWAQVLDRQEYAEEAWEVMRWIWEALRERRAPLRSWLRAAVGGLTLAPAAGTGTCLSILAERLGRIRPPAARFQLLHRLEEAAVAVEVDPAVQKKLLRLARTPWYTRPAPAPNVSERAALGLAAAEFLRVADSGTEARKMLDGVVIDPADEMVWLRWMRAQERLGPAESEERQPPEWISLCDRHPGLGAVYMITLASHRKNLDPPHRTAQRLDKAEDLLQRVVTSQRWAARLHEIRAEVAQWEGQPDSANRSAADAARIWGELGDDRRQVTLGKSYELGHHSAELDTAIMELRISRVAPPVVDVHGGGARIKVVARLPGGKEFSEIRPGDEVGYRQERGSASVRSIVDRLREDPDAWARRLANMLPPEGRALIADPPSGGRVDVRLVCDTRELAAMPWELAQADERSHLPLVRLPFVSTVYRSPPTDVRAENHTLALQAILRILGFFDGLPDGLMGGLTHTALHAFQRRVGLPHKERADRPTWSALRAALSKQPRRTVRVLVIRPGRYREIVRRRGTTAGGGDLAHIYQSHGMSVRVIEDPAPELLRLQVPLFRKTPPDIIHLTGTVLFESGATVVDFGGDAATRSMVKGSAGGDQIPVTALGDLVAAAARPSFGPIVIVDASWPGSQSEALRALLVRNSFAHQLFGLGRAIAVIATGLAPVKDQELLYELLIGGFGRGADPATVVGEVQRATLDHPSPLAHLPFTSTALFVQRSPYTFLPPGT